MTYSRCQCIPQIQDGKLLSEWLDSMTVEKCDVECRCIRKSICIRLINLLDWWHIKEAEKEYKKFYPIR